MASEKITAIIEELKGLTVLELSELVHAVEDEFGVSAAAAVAVAGPAADGGAAAAEQTEFDVVQEEHRPRAQRSAACLIQSVHNRPPCLIPERPRVDKMRGACPFSQRIAYTFFMIF